jgi:hypothetical protein
VSTSKVTTGEIFEVFQHWVSLCRTSAKGRKPVLGDRRRTRIEKAIGMYGVEACKDAISGATHSPWHMGHNPQGKKYDDIELVLRDEKHIEMFLDIYDGVEEGFKVIEDYANTDDLL